MYNQSELFKNIPFSSSIRHFCFIYKYFLFKKSSYKRLTHCLSKLTGRNNTGKICIFHRAGRQIRNYRLIDYLRHSSVNIPSVVKRLEYDPNRSSFIAFICSKNGIYSYILAPFGMKINDVVYRFTHLSEFFFSGYCSLLKDMPEGTIIYNIEKYPFFGGSLTRAAGCYSLLLRKNHLTNRALVKISSGKNLLVSLYCSASVGTVSNKFNNFINFGKAGRSRWLGYRPHVRGVAMNPVDHPHGGGEGKKSGRVCSTSPWGKLTKGQKTRKI